MKRGKIRRMVAQTDDKPRRMGRPPLAPEFRLRRRLALLSPDQCERLQQASQMLGLSEAAIIRRALDRELEQVGVA